jgi:hypothetical protein
MLSGEEEEEEDGGPGAECGNELKYGAGVKAAEGEEIPDVIAWARLEVPEKRKMPEVARGLHSMATSLEGVPSVSIMSKAS